MAHSLNRVKAWQTRRRGLVEQALNAIQPSFQPTQQGSSMAKSSTRTETDTFGPIEVAADAYW
ncbi:MAG: hypothetical protein ACKVON_04375, partial [Beijerinckiaceae bacterium]